MRPSSDPRDAPRPLALTQATALVVGSMVGTGVFTTTGLMLEQLRSPVLVLVVWAAAGVLALAGAAVYAELGAMMPRAGGEYVYLSRAYPQVVGFLSGWVALLVGFAAPVAAGALAFGRYVAALVPGAGVKPVALALVAGATLLHARDVRRGGVVQTAVTAFVVAVIVGFVIVAALSGHAVWSRLGAPALPSGSAGRAGAVAVSLVYVSYSYFGWNAAAYVAGEVRDPQRTLPRALVGGAALVTALYLALNVVFLASVPPATLAGRIEVGDVAARALLGPRGGAALSGLMAAALAGSVGALVMTGPRVVQAMAQDGLFFGALAHTNSRGAPAAAVILQGALSAIGVVTAGFEPLLVYIGFTLTLSAAATVTAAFVLRRREPDAPRPHRALAWPASGIIFVAFALYMTGFAVRERPVESAAGLGTLALGAAAWTLWRRRV